MPPIEPIDAPLSIAPLAATVRASSNFRFAWQWFSCPEAAQSGIAEARDILGTVIARADCDAFLTESVDSSPFTIEHLHEHVGFVAADGAFEQVLARAAADQLGAYSRILSEATPAQVVEIQALFGSLGPYRAFELNPGSARKSLSQLVSLLQVLDCVVDLVVKPRTAA